MNETTTPATSTTAAATPSSVTTTTTVKPGYKTTEFWLALAAKLLSAAYMAGLIGDGSTTARIAGLAGVILTTLGYNVTRTLVKNAAVAA